MATTHRNKGVQPSITIMHTKVVRLVEEACRSCGPPHILPNGIKPIWDWTEFYICTK